MTREEFQKLAESGVILLDGATGSNLRKAGMPVGVSTELWVLEHPQVIQKLQLEYAEAGSQIIYAPTFSANRMSLAMHDFQGDIRKLNADLVNITKEAVGGRAYVAGDMTTTGKMLEPAGDTSYQELMQVYQEQAKALYNAGVDLIIAETMLSVDETVVLLDAVQSVCNLPVMCSLTVEADGSIFSGGNAIEAAASLEAAGADAVGVNCSVGPDQLVSVIRNIKENVSIPVIAKPNAGMPFIDDKGNAVYSMKAAEFAAHIKALVDAGAGIVGGCCGTTPEYIKEVAKILVH